MLKLGDDVDQASAIYLKDWLTLIALIAGPVLAVWLTLWHQGKADKMGAKRRIFMSLMAYRKTANNPNQEWVNSLNLIDVTFENDPEVIAKWRSVYDILDQRQAGTPRWQHAYIELLSAMAQVLGYKRLTQTDIDKFYIPQGHVDYSVRQAEAQTELVRVLKASHSFSRSSDGKP